MVVRVWRWGGDSVCEGERVLMGGGRGWWVEAQVLTHAAEVDWRGRGKDSHTHAHHTNNSTVKYSLNTGYGDRPS